MPREPIDYALSYYARYPVIAPATYPPLFALIEGVGYRIIAPSPYVARGFVLAFAIVAGAYVMAWLRRWIDASLGWAAAFLAFVPAFVLWSNAVMLNVPATALAVASLYHFRRALDGSDRKQLAFTALFLMAVALTYYPAVSVLAVLVVWAARRFWASGLHGRSCANRRRGRGGRRHSTVSCRVACAGAYRQESADAGVPAFAGHVDLLLASIARCCRSAGVMLGTAGCAAGLGHARWRAEALFVAAWIAVPILSMSVLPARDARYILLVAPAFIVGSAIAAACLAPRIRFAGGVSTAAALAIALAAGVWYSTHTRVPNVAGFRDVAEYLRDHAPAETVLYDGDYDGLFGFYVRVLDPGFERRLVLADKFLYDDGPTTTFRWQLQSNVATADDVVRLVRTRCGCRWVAIEVGPGIRNASGSRLLREALARSDFERIRTFPISGTGQRRVDLYRVLGDVDPITTVGLRFPSLNGRTYPRSCLFHDRAPLLRLLHESHVDQLSSALVPASIPHREIGCPVSGRTSARVLTVFGRMVVGPRRGRLRGSPARESRQGT